MGTNEKSSERVNGQVGNCFLCKTDVDEQQSTVNSDMMIRKAWKSL